MANTKRPLSPHLQVYRPQITSTLSILHRATGIVLAIGALLFSYWLLSATYGPEK
jgi:succinate dehydrogenase / fumarate reductase cytochrome b subunit